MFNFAHMINLSGDMELYIEDIKAINATAGDELIYQIFATGESIVFHDDSDLFDIADSGEIRFIPTEEDVGDHLDEASEEVALLGGLLGGFGLASLLHTQGDQLVVDVIDIAGTDDDLVHATCREGALDVHVVVERGLVDLLLIIQHQAKTGCAVRCC